MKLLVIIATVFAAQTFGSVYSQNTQLDLDLNNKPIREALRILESSSKFKFFFNEDFINVDTPISLTVEDSKIDDILDRMFEKTEIEYQMLENNIIVLTKRDLSPMQQKRVQGTIIDASSGEPIVGANIIIENTTIGTISDIEGRFSLEVNKQDAVLVVSFLGYNTEKVSVGEQTNMEIKLIPDITNLEEVVVVGYGTIKKSVATGAISSVPMSSIQPVATQRVDQMLQGRASGVLVLNTDGAPGGNTTIRIRGMNSIQGGNQALIVIDGFQGGDLKSLNPNDIASIEILKDASATAIYGAQGANGVILIETKKGKTDKPVINYSTEFGFSKILMGGIEMMDAAEYAREMNRYAMLNNLDITPVPVFTNEQIQEFETKGGTDWMDEVYRIGRTQTQQLSLSGKTNKINYFLSGSYFDQKGILINSGYNRYSLRANLGAEINEWLNMGVNWDVSQQDRSGPDFGGNINWNANPVLGAILFPPTIPVYDEFGNYSKASTSYGEPGIWNPIASTKEPSVERKTTQNNATIYLDFKLLKGLSLKVTGGARLVNWASMQFYNDKTITGQQAGGVGRASNSTSKDYQNSNILTYTRDFGKHHINAIAVGEIKFSTSYSSSIDNSNFTVQETGFYNLGGASKQVTGSSYSERKINSALTRVNYGYDNRYVLSFSYRADGSSVFGANNKWAYFPSASAGWRLSEESFMKNFNLFNNLMLRASWGKTGNQAISPYRTWAKITGAGFYPWDGGESSNLAFQISSASNPNLKWESTTQTNFGLDISILRGKLRFTAEYYDKTTNDLLLARDLPRTTGLSSIIDNVGSMSNKGVEFSLDADISKGDFSWTTGVSFTASKTKVLDLGEDEFIPYYASGSGAGTELANMYLTVGEPFGQIMGFGYEGTWKTEEAEEAGKYGQMPGDPKYTDVNGDYRIDFDNDWKVIGNALPDFIFGLTNQINYKDWELTFLVQGTYGNDIFNAARVRREYEHGYSTNKLNRWTTDNQNTDVPALIDKRSREDYRLAWNASHPENPLVSTVVLPSRGINMTGRYLEDGSYLRLRNLTLAYNFQMKKYIKTLRVYFTGTNLLTLTKYTGWDPEVSSYTDNDAQLGTDYNNYPNSRTYSFGVNVTF